MKKILVVGIQHNEFPTNPTIEFLVNTEKCLNFREAVKNACADYFGTKEGYQVYKEHVTGDVFSWVDMCNKIPDDICFKYGFTKISNLSPDMLVDAGESLLCEPSFSYEQWEELKDMLTNRNTENRRTYLRTFLTAGGIDNMTVERIKRHFIDAEYMKELLDIVRPGMAVSYLKLWYKRLKTESVSGSV